MVFSFESPVQRSLVEITGSDATIDVPDPNRFGGDIRVVRSGETGGAAFPADGGAFGRGLGVLDLARAIRTGGRPRASGALGLHVLDVMVAIEESVASGQPSTVGSRAERRPLAPADWAATSATL
jgi:predicted dehydrogenase